MKIILTRNEMLEILIKGVQERLGEKPLINPGIIFMNDRKNIDVESRYLITHIQVEEDSVPY